MMSLRDIRNLSDKAAREAARQKKTPYVPFDADEVERLTSLPFPFLGRYVPKGWELVEELFCDATGMGYESEPALTVRALKEKLKAGLEHGYGYAILEAGQFQVYVGVFKRG